MYHLELKWLQLKRWQWKFSATYHLNDLWFKVSFQRCLTEEWCHVKNNIADNLNVVSILIRKFGCHGNNFCQIVNSHFHIFNSDVDLQKETWNYFFSNMTVACNYPLYSNPIRASKLNVVKPAVHTNNTHVNKQLQEITQTQQVVENNRKKHKGTKTFPSLHSKLF